MNVLVTGASGFIASQIVTDLIASGHQVTCCVRDVAYTHNLFPTATIIPCDFIHEQSSAIWSERLTNIDVVINSVGILYHPKEQVTWAIHYHTPRALFDACVSAGVKKIIQISALGIEQSDVVYATSKKAADDYLQTLPVQSIIIRPSLVYGRGSYGGSSLFRGLAGLPWMTPVPDKGSQEFQPIYLEDLSKAVVRLMEQPSDHHLILNAVSAKRINLANILTQMRTWLGFSNTKLIHVPLTLIRLGAWIGDRIPYSIFNSDSYKLLFQNNVTSSEETQKFHQHIGFTPREFTSGLYSHPSSIQDRWHSRLYFLKPVLKFSIAFIWLFTAICCLFIYPRASSYELLAQIGVNEFWQPILFYGASILDAALGVAVLCSKSTRVGLLQIILIISYSVILTWKLPSLWFEPFAPLAKNIPLLAAILVSMSLESDR